MLVFTINTNKQHLYVLAANNIKEYCSPSLLSKQGEKAVLEANPLMSQPRWTAQALASRSLQTQQVRF